MTIIPAMILGFGSGYGCHLLAIGCVNQGITTIIISIIIGIGLFEITNL